MRMIVHIVGVATIVLGPLLGLGPSFDGDRPDQKIVSAARQVPETSDDACLLEDFHMRVWEYVELHRRLEGPLPPLMLSNNPKEIRAAVDSLKQELRAARLNARRGDFFTSDIARLFHRTIHQTFKSTDWVEVLAAFEEENANRTASPKVNASYPGSAPLVPMSPRLLLALPGLPEELQYRFMYRALILWDVHAELIVDFIPDVIPLKLNQSVK